VRRLKSMIRATEAKTLIQMDGGVTVENCRILVDAGADVLVSGSAFFSHPPYKQRHEAFLKAAQAE